MSPGIFFLSLAGLAGGTYLIRLLGVSLGALAERPRSRTTSAPVSDIPTVDQIETQSRTRRWMDRTTIVLICAVAANNMFFEGQAFVGPARIVGAGVGILAALFKVPMLACVLLAMATCAILRACGIA